MLLGNVLLWWPFSVAYNLPKWPMANINISFNDLIGFAVTEAEFIK